MRNKRYEGTKIPGRRSFPQRKCLLWSFSLLRPWSIPFCLESRSISCSRTIYSLPTWRVCRKLAKMPQDHQLPCCSCGCSIRKEHSQTTLLEALHRCTIKQPSSQLSQSAPATIRSRLLKAGLITESPNYKLSTGGPTPNSEWRAGILFEDLNAPWLVRCSLTALSLKRIMNLIALFCHGLMTFLSLFALNSKHHCGPFKDTTPNYTLDQSASGLKWFSFYMTSKTVGQLRKLFYVRNVCCSRHTLSRY